MLLADQDRRRWDVAGIGRGRAALERAGRGGHGLGAYGLQAAIAECHASAPSVEGTDWERIVAFYDALARLAPSAVVELNRAVAIAMARGPAAGLGLVDELAAGERLAGSHLLPSVRGELLARLGRTEDALGAGARRAPVRHRPGAHRARAQARQSRVVPTPQWRARSVDPVGRRCPLGFPRR